MSLRRAAHGLRLRVLDAADVLLRRRRPLTPPRRAIEFIGGSNFEAIGKHLAEVAIGVGRLQPDQRIIDVGCGYGRLAVALTRYIDRGEYDGFDISRAAIRWCAKNIERRYPRFHFTHADVHNGHYNRTGRITADEFVFPYATASADVVFAASVFTHLTRAAAQQYLRESARVLKTGGSLVASFFVLDDESLPRVREGRTSPKFEVVQNDLAVESASDPESAMAFSESAVRAMFVDAGLRVAEIHPGAWRERAHALSYQDFVVAAKP